MEKLKELFADSSADLLSDMETVRPVVEELLEDLDELMGQSAPYTLAEWEQRPWYRRTFAALLKLGAIWL